MVDADHRQHFASSLCASCGSAGIGASVVVVRNELAVSRVSDLQRSVRCCVLQYGEKRTVLLSCSHSVLLKGWEGVWISFAIGVCVLSPLSLLSAKVPSFAIVASPATAFCTGFICRALVVANLLPRGCLSGTELSAISNCFKNVFGLPLFFLTVVLQSLWLLVYR